MDTQNVWVGNYGDYIIPKELKDNVAFTKRGYPDKRNKKTYAIFMAWVKDQDIA